MFKDDVEKGKGSKEMPKIQEKSSNEWSVAFPWWEEEKKGLGQNRRGGEYFAGEGRVSLSQGKKTRKRKRGLSE